MVNGSSLFRISPIQFNITRSFRKKFHQNLSSFGLPITASVTLAVLVVVMMVMAFLFAVVVFASRFGVDVRDDHFPFFTNDFSVACSIIRVIECFLARCLSVMVMTLAALRLFRIA
jgi:hypothetical protein